MKLKLDKEYLAPHEWVDHRFDRRQYTKTIYKFFDVNFPGVAICQGNFN